MVEKCSVWYVYTLGTCHLKRKGDWMENINEGFGDPKLCDKTVDGSIVKSVVRINKILQKMKFLGAKIKSINIVKQDSIMYYSDKSICETSVI